MRETRKPQELKRQMIGRKAIAWENIAIITYCWKKDEIYQKCDRKWKTRKWHMLKRYIWDTQHRRNYSAISSQRKDGKSHTATKKLNHKQRTTCLTRSTVHLAKLTNCTRGTISAWGRSALRTGQARVTSTHSLIRLVGSCRIGLVI